MRFAHQGLHTCSNGSTSRAVIKQAPLLSGVAEPDLQIGSENLLPARRLEAARSALVVARGPLMGLGSQTGEEVHGRAWLIPIGGLTERQRPGGSENSRCQVRRSNSGEHACLMAGFTEGKTHVCQHVARLNGRGGDGGWHIYLMPSTENYRSGTHCVLRACPCLRRCSLSGDQRPFSLGLLSVSLVSY